MTSHSEVLDMGQVGALKVSGHLGGKCGGDHTPAGLIRKIHCYASGHLWLGIKVLVTASCVKSRKGCCISNRLAEDPGEFHQLTQR